MRSPSRGVVTRQRHGLTRSRGAVTAACARRSSEAAGLEEEEEGEERPRLLLMVLTVPVAEEAEGMVERMKSPPPFLQVPR